MSLISSSGSTLPPDSTATAGPVPGDLAGEQRGEADRAGGLDHRLGPLEQEQRARRLISSSVTVTTSST